jgi:hypothetical protein
MSDRTSPRREGKKIGKTWNHDLIRHRLSTSEGQEPRDRIKQAWRAPMKVELKKELES